MKRGARLDVASFMIDDVRNQTLEHSRETNKVELKPTWSTAKKAGGSE